MMTASRMHGLASSFLGKDRTNLRTSIERRIKKLGLGGSAWDYAQHIGRRFGSLEVVTVSAKESDGVIYYIYTCRCHRCGRMCTKRASVFLSGKLRDCVHCGCQRSSARVKNPAVNYANPWRRKTWRSVESLGLPARVAMCGYTGFFTLFFGTPEFMEALIDDKLRR